MRGLLVVVCSPSGGGKTSICKEYVKGEPDAKFSVSLTTRQPRENESEGSDYRFVTEREFEAAVDSGELVEHELVHGKNYGTPRSEIEWSLTEGKILLLDIDVKGGLKIKEKYPEDTLTVFIKPPSKRDLIKRLRERGLETEDEIAKRLMRYDWEMDSAESFDEVIINDDFETTVTEFTEVINKRRSSRSDGT